jgi:H+/gluconate symporter-like permease
MASGFCIYFGNLAQQYALALAGVTVSVPIFSSCIVVLGAFLSLCMLRHVRHDAWPGAC